MSYTLFVQSGETTLAQFELADGRHRVGSRKDLEIQVDHPEIDGLVSSVDIRGGAIFLRNLNPFPIYVGDFELAPSDQTEWRPGLPVLLTQSVVLEIQNNEARMSDREEEARVKRKRTMNQAAIIGLCSVVGVYMLFTESPGKDTTQKFPFTFHDLVEELSKKPSHQHKIIGNYLSDARMADIRWGKDNPKRAISSYQLLLDEKLIREAPSSTDTVEGKIKTFALARVDDLSAFLKKD